VSRLAAWAALVPAAALVAACAGDAPEPEPEATEVPKELAGAPPAPVPAGGIGTPMNERVAVLGLLNKRNNISRDIEMKPGESRRVGDVVLRLSACERTAPWETTPEIGAFVQVISNERRDADSRLEWHRVFSGWLFRNSPSLNVVEHPIYDVWVKDCRMSFPGEEGGPPAASGTPAAAPRATPSPTAAPSPSPTATPEAQNDA